MISDTYLFSHGLATLLQEGSVESIDDTGYRILGILDTGPVAVNIEIIVPKRLEYLKIYPPKVKCHAPWMRIGKEWHNSKSEGMCWVLQEEWAGELWYEGKPSVCILKKHASGLLSPPKI
jgi:hypothetical protein